jgi:putative transposase
MQLTQKIRIFPTPEQEETLCKLSERCRLLYNFALAERIEAWKDGKRVGYRKQQNDLPEIRRRYPEYGWVYSKVLQMVLRQLDADYKSFYALRTNDHKEARPPRFKGRGHFVAMLHNQSGFKITRGKIALSHFCTDVPLEFEIPEKFEFEKVYQVAVYKDGAAFYLSIVYKREEKPYADNGLYQAIDLGVGKIVTAVNSHGTFIEVKNQRPDKYWQPIIESLQVKRDHCKKDSNRWERLTRNLQRCHRKCANQLRDFQHKLRRKLVDRTRANTLIIGALEVKEMAQSRRVPRQIRKSLNRATQNTGTPSRFARFLTYKAQLVGKKVIELDEGGTTRTCYDCGGAHEMEIWDRTMKCECGNELDRDRNAAVNLVLRFLSQNAQWTGYSQFAGNLRHTGLLAPREPVVHPQEAPPFRTGWFTMHALPMLP